MLEALPGLNVNLKYWNVICHNPPFGCQQNKTFTILPFLSSRTPKAVWTEAAKLRP